MAIAVRDLDRDLADVVAALEPLISCLVVREREGLIEDRMHLVQSHGPQQCFEVRPRSNRCSRHVKAARENIDRRKAAAEAAGEANQRDVAALAGCRRRLRDRLIACDVDGLVDPSAVGEGEDFLIPVGMGPVVDYRRGSQCLETSAFSSDDVIARTFAPNVVAPWSEKSATPPVP